MQQTLKYLKDIPRELNANNIDKAIRDYIKTLEDIPLHLQSKDFLELMYRLKREKLDKGPYKGVTLFEASNRIMTDLTILFGVKSLLASNIPAISYEKYTVELGNESKHTHDIEAQHNGFSLIGEAFNVAPSFFPGKKNASLKKLRETRNTDTTKQLLIMYNADAHGENKEPKQNGNEFYLPVMIDLSVENHLNSSL
ncbi:MAG: hypothetical protein KA149_11130 [Chitinophagales bacterium]|nr:hypothetical protein [Chitinophagales bacterium]